MANHSIAFQINRIADTWEQHSPAIWSTLDQVCVLFIQKFYIYIITSIGWITWKIGMNKRMV